METLNLILLNITVFSGSLAIANRLLEKNDTIHLFAYTGFFYIAQIIFLQTFLGIFELLNVVDLSILTYSFNLPIIFLLGKDFFKKEKSEIKAKSHSTLLLILPFLPLAIILIIELFNALIQPVWEYDSLTYHLPMIAEWIKTESLWSIFYSAYSGPIAYYPGNGELLSMWYMLPLGNDYLANIQNIILLPIFIITALSLGKKIKLPTSISVLFCALFAYSPIVLKEIGTPHVDLLFALSFLYCIYFFIDYSRTKHPKYIVFFLSALAIFIGTKYLALPFGAIIGTIFFLYAFRIKTIKYFLLSIIPVLFLGKFFFLRNFFITGNPLFPSAVSLGPLTIFEGYRNMTKDIFSWSLLKNIPSLSYVETFEMIKRYFFRTGYQTFMILFALIPAIYLLFKKSTRKISGTLIIFLGLFFFMYLISPFSYIDFDANIRYSILALLCGYALIAYTAWKVPGLKIPIFSATTILIGLSLIITFITPDLPHEIFNLKLISAYPDLATTFFVKILFFILLLLLSIKFFNNKKLVALAILILIPCALFSFNGQIFQTKEKIKYEILTHKYPEFYKNLFAGFDWLEKNTAPTAKISYTGFNLHYPLHSTHFNKNIFYTNINTCTNCLYHEFKNSPNGILSNPDKEAWLSNLKSSGINYLIVFNEGNLLKYEPDWIASTPDKFEKVFSIDTVNIYLIQ